MNELATQLVARLSQDPHLSDVNSSGLRRAPSLSLDIDKVKAGSLGLAPADITELTQAAVGPIRAGNFTRFGRTWPILIELGSGDLTDVDALKRLKVRSKNGELVPLSAVAAWRREDQPNHLERSGLLPSVTITANPARGFTQAEARNVCDRLAAEILPKQPTTEYRLVWLRGSSPP